MNKLKFFSAPISVNLEITDECNLKCFFCYCGDKSYKQSTPFIQTSEKIKNIFKILDILKENNIFEIRFLGGEFSLLKDWKNIVSYAHKKGFFLSFVSNGTLFTKEDVDFLVSNEISSCTISLHGTENLNDEIVGVRGSYKKAVKSISLLVEGGIETNVIFTPTKINIYYFEEFAKKIINNFGVKNIGINRLFQGDRYENLNFSDYKFIFRTIEKLQKQGYSVYFVDSFPLCKIPLKYWQFTSRCSQGVSFCQINYLGNVKNCSSLSVNIGNILNEDMHSLWQNKLSKLRSLKHLPLSCRLCPIFCGGGCLASRTVEKNYIADEFIKLPSQESLPESIFITIKNYIKKLYFKKNIVISQKNKHKNWELSSIPKVLNKFKIRKEADDCYVCMIQKKGSMMLNEKSLNILNCIDGKSSLDEIIKKSSKILNLKITKNEINEVLDMFID